MNNIVLSLMVSNEELEDIIGKNWFNIEKEEHKNEFGITRIFFLSLLNGDNFDISEDDDIPNIRQLYDFGHSIGIEAGGIVLLSNDVARSSPNCALGFLETSKSAEASFEALCNLSNLGFRSIRILMVRPNCSMFDFAAFGVYFACPSNEDAFDIDHEDGLTIFKEIMMENIRKHCKSLQESEDHPKCSGLKILRGSQRKSMPSAERVSSIVQSDLYPSLDECLEIFNSPLDPKENKASPILPVIDWGNVKNIIDGM